jgi:threonine/homoserine/homoserine lactone efflux protein
MLSPTSLAQATTAEYTLWHPDRITQDSKVPVALLIYFMVDILFSLTNFLAYVRHEEDRYGKDFVKAYLAFVVLGLVFFGALASVLWVWAARYSTSHKERRRRTALGVVVVYLSNVLPLFIMEYHAILCCGWVSGIQGFCFVLKTISWLGASVMVWLSYTWRAARWMEYHFTLVGTTAQDTRSSSTPLMMSASTTMPLAANDSLYSNGGYRISSPGATNGSAPFGSSNYAGPIPVGYVDADCYSNPGGGSEYQGRTNSPGSFFQKYYPQTQPSRNIVQSPSHSSLYSERRAFGNI